MAYRCAVMKETHLELLVLSDLHFTNHASESCPVPERKGILAAELAVRAIREARRQFQPDALVLLGDLVNDGTLPGAGRDLEELRQELRIFEGPILAVRGNHDLPKERFAEILDQRPGITRLKGVCLLSFWDSWNERDEGFRDPTHMRQLEEIRGNDEVLIVLQHNPLHPPIASTYPFMLSCAEEIMSRYHDAHVCLSLSGHFHPGQESSCSDGVQYVTAPALCEFPHKYLRVSVQGLKVQVSAFSLGLPDRPSLMDLHCHTEFAYCGEDVSVSGAIQRAQALKLDALAFAEHAGQLYVTREQFWSAAHLQGRHVLQQAVRDGQGRMKNFKRTVLSERSDRLKVGLEVELDKDGELTLLEEDTEGWDHLVGAVHWLPPPYDSSSQVEAERGFMATTEKLLAHGVQVLAHPFRFFRRAELQKPPHLYCPVAQLLAEYHVAAEINYHSNEPDPAFIACCLEQGVKISLGSDSHRLYEVADFHPHLRLLRQVTGDSSNLEEILFRI